MSKTLAVIFLMQIGSVYSQFAFFNDYQSDENIFISETIEIENVFVSCGVINGTSGASQGILTFVAIDGELIKRKYINSYFSVYFSSIIELNDGVIVSGTLADNGLVNQKKCIWKFDFLGNLVWEIPFGNSTMLLNDNSSPKLLNTSDGFIVFSSEFGGTTSTDGSITKFDLNGNIIWSKKFLNDHSELTNDICVYGTICSDGYAFILKSYHSSSIENEYFILKTDFYGAEIWRKNVTNLSMGTLNITGNNNVVYSIASTKENNLFALFCSEDNDSKSHRIYIVKYDSNGIIYNVNYILDERDIDPYKLVINEGNEMFLMGLDNSDFGTNTNLELFISKINIIGSLEWEARFGYKNSNELWSGGILTNDGGLLVGGSKFRTSQPFGYDHFLVKTDCEGNTIWDEVVCNSDDFEPVILYPNPTDGLIYFQFNTNLLIKGLEVTMYDECGRALESKIVQNDNKIMLDLTYLADGIYMVIFDINGNKVVKRIIIQK